MKTIALMFFGFAALSFTSAHAGNLVSFACKTDRALKDGKKYTIKFQVSDLGTRHPDLAPQGKDEDGIYVIVTPKNEDLMSLNENISFEVTSKALEINGDADGLELLQLHLYADSDFNKGYVRIDDTGNNTDSGDQFSTLTCRHD
jgi:hypothetical protein